MPSVDDTVLSEELVPRDEKTETGKWLDLHTYWESWYGGLANVSISIVEEKNGEFLENVDLLNEDVEKWKDGEFTNEDVVKRYGARFYAFLEKERQKIRPLRKQPTGRGRGWHGERERHRQAALLRIGKDSIPIPRTAKWQASMGLMKAMEEIKKHGHDIRHV